MISLVKSRCQPFFNKADFYLGFNFSTGTVNILKRKKITELIKDTFCSDMYDLWDIMKQNGHFGDKNSLDYTVDHGTTFLVPPGEVYFIQ